MTGPERRRRKPAAEAISLVPPPATDSAEPRPRVEALGARVLRRRPTLDRVMQDLGTTLLELLAGEPDAVGKVGGVAIHDPGDDAPFPDRAIVLGVGASDRETVLRLLERMRREDAVALVVRSPFLVDDALRAEFEASRIALLGLAHGAVWHQLTTLLGFSLGEVEENSLMPDSLGGVPTGDLFGLANAICALIDAPVTIEDRNSRVVAFSDRQDEADFIRIESILGRRTPRAYAKEDEVRGAMRAIRRSERPVYLEPIELDDEREALPRVAVAVRAGDEVLGSIWAVVKNALTPERDQLLLDSSRLVALHMLQLRAGADAEQRLISDLVAASFEGGPEAASAVARLGIDRAPCVVLAMTLDDSVEEGFADALTLSHRAAERQRMATALTLHLTASRAGSVVAALRDTVYAIVPAKRVQDAEVNIETSCRAFAQRSVSQQPVLIGIGRIAHDASELPRSRVDADRAVRVLRTARDGRLVARSSEVEIEALILELRDLADATARGPSGAYAQLLAYDEAHGASMIETLSAWLGAHGDIIAASAASHVHQNTFRYRLKRIAEIGEFELDDAQARFALELQLRIFPPDEQPG